MQSFSIWDNFTLRISLKPHYSFSVKESDLQNVRCYDNMEICNIVSQNFKTQCELQENGNLIQMNTRPVTLTISNSDFLMPVPVACLA